MEYIIGLAMMINSGIALILESGGVCRATLFGLQGYFNLSFFWDEALTGWKVYQKRRIAVCKIATLETAEEPTIIDDVCAICFNNLKPNHLNNVNSFFFNLTHIFYDTIFIIIYLLGINQSNPMSTLLSRRLSP